LRKAKAGTVWINTYGYTDVRLPWAACAIPAPATNGTAAINLTEPKRYGNLSV
jgi:aldehyde dehydrogenase (NAD+)